MAGGINLGFSFLPVTRKEFELLGWDRADIIIVSGDAYVDHPSFGSAIMARVAEFMGLRVAVLPQPNWRDDLRDFQKLGEPRLFFGVTAGAMDSMVNHYTARRRKRSNDAYTPGGKAGYRPDMPSIVYTRILKKLYPETPVILGGVEASMRRLTHYDYWQDMVRPSILLDSGADLLVYGMAEQPFKRIIELMKKGVPISSLHNIFQTAFVRRSDEQVLPLKNVEELQLPSHEECLTDKLAYAEAFRLFEENSNLYAGSRLIQVCGEKVVVVNPPYLPAEGKEADYPYGLPYTRLPHPRYINKPPIPAYEMIKFSVTAHRGCFGGCSFCAIAAHQGKFVISRSEQSIMKELQNVVEMPGFKGHVTDLGGPSANMYKMGGINLAICKKCRRPSCIYPAICKNLNYNHHHLLNLYDKATKLKGVKKLTIGSGVRIDMLVGRPADITAKHGLDQYVSRLLRHHVSGRLKVAPEHTETNVLNTMRKPGFKSFELFYGMFKRHIKRENLPWQLIPYFISGHPGCSDGDMKALSEKVRNLGLITEQAQEFTPTPMTLATTMYYTGIDPYTGKKVYSAKTDVQKKRQKAFLITALHRTNQKAGSLKKNRLPKKPKT